MNRARHGRANGAPVGSGLHLRLPISPPYRRDPAPQEGQRGARGMTGRLHLRHSTDKQTNARRLHALDDLPKSGSLRYENPATSSRMHAVNRSGFRKLLDEAAVGDTIRNAGAARLFRSTKDVIQIREGLQWRGLHRALRPAPGPASVSRPTTRKPSSSSHCSPGFWSSSATCFRRTPRKASPPRRGARRWGARPRSMRTRRPTSSTPTPRAPR
ncbi:MULTISPECIES: recombinase family protein [Streptomyces]|uniref:recombinase family protein n=2 Tax=Streptomyces TaxID=1883 RepID=UPI0033C7FE2F